MAQEKKESHEQPFPDCRPSLEPAEDFDEDMARAAAKKLREAMKGFGTNEKKIIQVTENYSHAQRMVIKQAFLQEYKRDLIKDFKSELSGKFEKFVLAFWRDPGVFDAKQIENAVDGMGFSTKLLNEIICTRTPNELKLMQAAWTKNKSMIDRIKDETKKMFGDGNYGTLLATILEGGRDENGAVDSDAAQADAEELNRMLNQDKKEAKAKFVEVFSQRSWVQLREISGVFQDVSKKYTMTGAIDKAFGDGDTGKALKTIDSFVCQPYDFWALKMREAMKGLGTDDEQLRRVIVSRAEIDLRDIGVVFGQRYGDGKTLQKWLKDDLGGDNERLALAVCGLE